MSTCILTIKNVSWMKRDIMLYQHTDGHPNSMVYVLKDTLREIYQEFSEHGDTAWFMDPSKLAGSLIARSIPVMTDEMRSMLKTLPSATKNRLESNFFLALPALLPEVSRVNVCNYEYSIILEEIVVGEETTFFGYSLEVYKLQNNKKLSTIMTNRENLLSKHSIVSLD